MRLAEDSDAEVIERSIVLQWRFANEGQDGPEIFGLFMMEFMLALAAATTAALFGLNPALMLLGSAMVARAFRMRE